MFNRDAEKTTSNLILFGAPLTTLFLMTGTVTDPVNATKLFVAGGLAGALVLIFLTFNLSVNFRIFLPLISAVVFFLLSGINAVVQSESPLSQNLYGAFGRNTGFIAYLALSFIALGALNLRETRNFEKIIWGLFFSGIVNVVYCLWVLAFGDFLGWSNPYGNILGLFGNPNFISAFLGIFICSLLAYVVPNKTKMLYRALALVVSLLAFYSIYRSNAIQGIVVTFAGLGIVGFFIIRSKFNSKISSLAYLFLYFAAALVAVFGSLQKGPLSFIYKRSVSLRGSYWKSALEMGANNPFSGVGMDAYGDWYRRSRPPIALVDTPGINTTSNAAHNVVLDLFAYGGWPLVLSYLAMLAVGAHSIFRISLKRRNYDPVFVSMTTAWACYQLQSIISINQIGLAIWGWLLTGALVSYARLVSHDSSESKVDRIVRRRPKPQSFMEYFSPKLVAFLGAVIGLIISVPPLSADAKWRTALDSRDAKKVLEVLEPSYLTPLDTQRLIQAIQLFASSNLLLEAHEIAKKSVEFNPESFDSWRYLYFLSNSTPNEKAKALENLKRLDPFNPDVTKP